MTDETEARVLFWGSSEPPPGKAAAAGGYTLSEAEQMVDLMKAATARREKEKAGQPPQDAEDGPFVATAMPTPEAAFKSYHGKWRGVRHAEGRAKA